MWLSIASNAAHGESSDDFVVIFSILFPILCGLKQDGEKKDVALLLRCGAESRAVSFLKVPKPIFGMHFTKYVTSD